MGHPRRQFVLRAATVPLGLLLVEARAPETGMPRLDRDGETASGLN